MKKRLLAMLLTLTMLCSLPGGLTATSAADEEADSPICIDADTQWTEATTLSQNLYIAQETVLTVQDTVTVDGTVSVYGGGQLKLGADCSNSMIKVNSGSVLALKDVTIDGAAEWDVVNNTNAAVGFDSDSAKVTISTDPIIVEGTLTLDDGAVVQDFCVDAHNIIYGAPGSVININKGASLKYNKGNGGVFSAGTLNVCGGEVSHNYCTFRAGISFVNGTALKISDDADISYNYGNGGSNVNHAGGSALNL